MNTLQAIILAIIEGITEFLPISSTGHMVLVSSYFGIEKNDFVKLFEVVIQLGPIIAVVFYYYKKFFTAARLQFYSKLLIAVIPSLLFGALFHKYIDELLESPLVIGIALLGGGICLLFVDRIFHTKEVKKEEYITYKKGFFIGLWQCIAMIPGVSRSAATIVGGMQQKLDKGLAVEFSFFLAVPTMCAATAYKMMKAIQDAPYILSNKHDILLLGFSIIIAFIVALLAISFFISYVQKYGFKVFGYYRIILGIWVLIYFTWIK